MKKGSVIARSRIAVSIEPSANDIRLAEDVVGALERAGVAATVVLPCNLEAFMHRHAEQVLAAARKCRIPDVKSELEETARSILDELADLKRRSH
jgi:hypothetical protein